MEYWFYPWIRCRTSEQYHHRYLFFMLVLRTALDEMITELCNILYTSPN